MLTQAWSFLVTRNQSIDYKTVVAPDFISQAKIRSLLIKASEDDSSEEGKVLIRSIQGSEVGDLTIVFRVAKAKRRYIEEGGNDDILKDPFGREIYVIDGLVFREKSDKVFGKIRQIHLNQARKELKEQYSKFWNEDKISDSHAIDLIEDVSSPIIQLEELKPFLMTTNGQLTNVVPKRKSAINKVRLFSLIVIAIAILLLLGLFLGNSIATSRKLTELQSCRYVTQVEDINFENKNKDASKPLQELLDKHPKAWIFLEGDLNVKLSNNQKFDSATKTNKQPNSSERQPTITQDDGKLYMKHHPINTAIALLRDQTVTNSKLEATIVETKQKDASSRCITPEALRW
jgi:hypothetical protein